MGHQLTAQHGLVRHPGNAGGGRHGIHLEAGHRDRVALSVVEAVGAVDVDVLQHINARRRRGAGQVVLGPDGVGRSAPFGGKRCRGGGEQGSSAHEQLGFFHEVSSCG